METIGKSWLEVPSLYLVETIRKEVCLNIWERKGQECQVIF